ncbi:unnamed protein product [Mytilus coruscus]|uniref:Uncharacterized protein n=1 Tax=Mytilus coruscus TaxID=42192 RepID=A0A6J8DAL1_MYTCO|nr:unnamed protein product [Mytilus coruscus]
MNFYLNGGKLPDGRRLISEKAFKEIISPVNIIPNTMYTYKYYSKPKVPVTTAITGYALGWRSGFYGNALPQQHCHSLFIPQPWYDYTLKTKLNVTKSRAMSRQKKDYLGNYYNPAYGHIQVKGHKDMNKLTLIYGVSTFVLYPKEAKDEFYGDSVGLTKYIFNFYNFRFDDESDSPDLEIPTFELMSPPVFQKSRENANIASYIYHSGFDKLTFLVVLHADAQEITF